MCSLWPAIHAEVAAPPPQPSTRDVAVEKLSNTVFGRGNVHLKNVETLTSLPEGLHSFPEVCFIGKPNVGKSTVISCLLHNSRLPRAGHTAGTTRLLQFFNVGDALLLVDTPGYGWWCGRRLETKQAEQANAFSMLFRYLALRKHANLKRVYWLMEANARGPVQTQARDEDIRHFLARERIPFSILLTKTDRHWRAAMERSRRPGCVRIRRDGTPAHSPRRHTHDGRGGEEDATPEEGVLRNMSEVYAFLGTSDVPVLAVSANRLHPHRCRHLEALQHDITHYCSQELTDESELNLRGLQSLSYAPPRAEDVTRVQLHYPVESFVVPTDDRMSLATMVEMHNRAKAGYLTMHTQSARITAKDMRQCRLADDGVLGGGGERVGAAESLCLTAAALPLAPRISDASVVQAGVCVSSCVTPVCGVSTLSCVPNASAGTPPPTTVSLRHDDGAEKDGHILGRDAAAQAAVSLPFALDVEAQCTTAINGVAIPRSMVLASVEELALHKEDEMSAFALRSGAGAYEELLRTDDEASSARAAAPAHFVETTRDARLSEEEYEMLKRPTTKSAARQRSERMLNKYVARIRKDRSVYMQAEGYMCPWLADGGSARHGVDATVVGLLAGGGDGRPHSNHSGSLAAGSRMRGLKSCGFGGRSHSARTLRNRGRATKKTGFWAT